MVSEQRFTADEVSRFLRGAFTGDGEDIQEALEDAFERLTHGIDDPRSERADCNIELDQRPAVQAGRRGAGAVTAERADTPAQAWSGR